MSKSKSQVLREAVQKGSPNPAKAESKANLKSTFGIPKKVK